MKILFTGGGTAGHIFPIVAIAREIKKKTSLNELQLFYMGPRDEFAEELFGFEGIRMRTIMAGKIRRYFGVKSVIENVFDILIRIPLGFAQALYYIFTISPDLIFSKGGYGSLPSVLAGWLLMTPIFLHESDATPGLANKLMSRLSLEIFVSFPVEKMDYFPRQKMIAAGNPIRSEILAGQKDKAKELFKLKGSRPVILILGGSQGSQRINDAVLSILPDLLTDFELLHQTGEKNFKQAKAEASVVLAPEKYKNLQEYYHIFPFLKEEELKHAYQVADLVIARAGSGTIFEVAAVGKASLLIPLPEAAQNHQLKNAYIFAENGACQVLEETNLTSRFFLERIRYFFSNPEKLRQMERGAKYFSRPISAQLIAEYLLEYLAK